MKKKLIKIIGILSGLITLFVVSFLLLLSYLSSNKQTDYEKINEMFNNKTVDHTNSYHSVHGWVGVTEYISFNLPKEKLWEVATEIANISKDKFESPKDIEMDTPEEWTGVKEEKFNFDNVINFKFKKFMLNGSIRSQILISENENKLYIKVISND